MDGSEERTTDKKFAAFLASCISEAVESGWGQEQPSDGFWAVTRVFSGQSPDELFQLAAKEEEALALAVLMPYVKQETVESYIHSSFEKDDAGSLMVILSEASDHFQINIDDLARRAIENGEFDMYLILEPYLSPDHCAELRKKAEDQFFPVFEVAPLPPLPPLPALP